MPITVHFCVVLESRKFIQRVETNKPPLRDGFGNLRSMRRVVNKSQQCRHGERRALERSLRSPLDLQRLHEERGLSMSLFLTWKRTRCLLRKPPVQRTARQLSPSQEERNPFMFRLRSLISMILSQELMKMNLETNMTRLMCLHHHRPSAPRANQEPRLLVLRPQPSQKQSHLPNPSPLLSECLSLLPNRTRKNNQSHSPLNAEKMPRRTRLSLPRRVKTSLLPESLRYNPKTRKRKRESW